MEIYNLIYILFHIFGLFSSVSADVCQTPDHHEGLCKVIGECPPVFKILQQLAKTPNKDVAEYFSKSRCGFSGMFPKVCCPKDAINISEGSSSPFLLNTTGCGYFSEDRIYRDKYTSIGDFPWTVLLRYNTAEDRKEIYCGGVLISERYVLTAAHCVQGRRNATLISVRLGEYNLDTNPDCETFIAGVLDCNDSLLDVPVEEVIVHEDYNASDPNQYHDIALIRLQNKVKFNDFVQPVCLFGKTQSQSNSIRYTVAGWGVDDSQIKYITKNRSPVFFEDAATCEDAFKVKLNQNQICVAQKYGCVRDSGGSLIEVSHQDYHFYAAGVTSLGSCNSEDRLVVFTRVDRYKNWIISKLKD